MIFHYLPFAIENANLFNFQAGLSKYDKLYYKRKILVDSLLVQVFMFNSSWASHF